MRPAPRDPVSRAGGPPRPEGSFAGSIAIVSPTLVSAVPLTLDDRIGWHGRRGLGRRALLGGARLDTLTTRRRRSTARAPAALREDAREALERFGRMGQAGRDLIFICPRGGIESFGEREKRVDAHRIVRAVRDALTDLRVPDA